ncbi:hypothetical protein ACLOJK_008038 [Asimina triloba]
MPDLPNLKILHISHFGNERLPDGGWERLVALQTLELWRCTGLKSLPGGLARLQSLENLLIKGCSKLESLEYLYIEEEDVGKLERLPGEEEGLGQLKKLNPLKVSNCKALGSLPHGLQHLALLRVLNIIGCPLLSKRCNVGGEDWPKISHIPSISIDGERIQ